MTGAALINHLIAECEEADAEAIACDRAEDFAGRDRWRTAARTLVDLAIEELDAQAVAR